MFTELERATTLHHIVFLGSEFISEISLSDCSYGVGDQLFLSIYRNKMSKILNREDVSAVVNLTQIKSK